MNGGATALRRSEYASTILTHTERETRAGRARYLGLTKGDPPAHYNPLESGPPEDVPITLRASNLDDEDAC